MASIISLGKPIRVKSKASEKYYLEVEDLDDEPYLVVIFHYRPKGKFIYVVLLVWTNTCSDVLKARGIIRPTDRPRSQQTNRTINRDDGVEETMPVLEARKAGGVPSAKEEIQDELMADEQEEEVITDDLLLEEDELLEEKKEEVKEEVKEEEDAVRTQEPDPSGYINVRVSYEHFESTVLHANNICSVTTLCTHQSEIKSIDRQCELLQEEKQAISAQIDIAKQFAPVDLALQNDLLQQKRKVIQEERRLVDKRTALQKRLMLERKRRRSRPPEGPSPPTRVRKSGQGSVKVGNNADVIDLTND